MDKVWSQLRETDANDVSTMRSYILKKRDKELILSQKVGNHFAGHVCDDIITQKTINPVKTEPTGTTVEYTKAKKAEKETARGL